MDRSRSYTGEKHAVSFHFLTEFLDIPWAKNVNSTVGKRRRWFESFLGKVGYFFLLYVCPQLLASDAILFESRDRTATSSDAVTGGANFIEGEASSPVSSLLVEILYHKLCDVSF